MLNAFGNPDGEPHDARPSCIIGATMRKCHAQTFALSGAAMAMGHIGRSPSFVDEYDVSGFQRHLTIEPVMRLFQNVGSILLYRH